MKKISEIQTLDECRREVLRVAKGILDGSIGIAAGARELTEWLCFLSLSDDPDALLLDQIESETAHFPAGEVRRHWSLQALELKDDELKRYEAQIREKAFQACEALILKYEHADYSGQPFPHVDGVGVALADEDGALMIVAIVPGSPAARAGLSVGQIIQKIDETAIDPNEPGTWRGKLRGKPGTKVRVTLADTTQGKPHTVGLVRERIV